MDRRRRKMMWRLAGTAIVAMVLTAAGILWWFYMMHAPRRLETDCRGRGIDAAAMKRWEETGRNDSLGIVNLAGWRIDDNQTVTSISTGRKWRTQVIAVYGSMELVFPSPILCGRYGLDVEGDYCVLSEALARRLFGSFDVAGECVKSERKKYIVAGVIGKEEEFLMVPMEDGEVEQMAVKVKGWMGAEDTLQRVLEQ